LFRLLLASATSLYEMDWAPERQISEMLGHIDESSQDAARTSRIYAKYRPEKLAKVVTALSILCWTSAGQRAHLLLHGRTKI